MTVMDRRYWTHEHTTGFIGSQFGWSQTDSDIQEDMRGRIAVVGLAGSGKKTLCNTLWGCEAVGDSGEMIRQFGLFTLIDLPADPHDSANVLYRLENAHLILYILDGTVELGQENFAWIARLRALNAELLIALNKCDQLDEISRDQKVKTLTEKLSRPVIPLYAQDVKQVHGEFISAVLDACPDLAVPLAAEFVGLRNRVARQLIFRTTLTSAALSLESYGEDFTAMMECQMRMVHRIAMLYGHRGRRADGLEMILNTGLRFVLQWLLRFAGHYQTRIKDWAASGMLAALTTIIVGRLAMAYYAGEFGKWINGMPRS